MQQLLTVQEYASIKRLSENTVRRRISSGQLRVERFGRAVRIVPDEPQRGFEQVDLPAYLRTRIGECPDVRTRGTPKDEGSAMKSEGKKIREPSKGGNWISCSSVHETIFTPNKTPKGPLAGQNQKHAIARAADNCSSAQIACEKRRALHGSMDLFKRNLRGTSDSSADYSLLQTDRELPYLLQVRQKASAGQTNRLRELETRASRKGKGHALLARPCYKNDKYK